MVAILQNKLSITAGQLETVRKNPLAYAQLLASNEKAARGSHGMVACVKEVARSMHVDELNINAGINLLHRKFQTFNPSRSNILKQNQLTEKLVTYQNEYSKKGFEFLISSKQMKWNITEFGKLTGLTPWVVKNKKGLFSYLIVEKASEWENELKFPLFQSFMSGNILNCETSDLNIGIYCLASNSFEFRSFSAKAIAESINETRALFADVNMEYSKIKKV